MADAKTGKASLESQSLLIKKISKEIDEAVHKLSPDGTLPETQIPKLLSPSLDNQGMLIKELADELKKTEEYLTKNPESTSATIVEKTKDHSDSKDLQNLFEEFASGRSKSLDFSDAKSASLQSHLDEITEKTAGSSSISDFGKAIERELYLRQQPSKEQMDLLIQQVNTATQNPEYIFDFNELHMQSLEHALHASKRMNDDNPFKPIWRKGLKDEINTRRFEDLETRVNFPNAPDAETQNEKTNTYDQGILYDQLQNKLPIIIKRKPGHNDLIFESFEANDAKAIAIRWQLVPKKSSHEADDTEEKNIEGRVLSNTGKWSNWEPYHPGSYQHEDASKILPRFERESTMENPKPLLVREENIGGNKYTPKDRDEAQAYLEWYSSLFPSKNPDAVDTSPVSDAASDLKKNSNRSATSADEFVVESHEASGRKGKGKSIAIDIEEASQGDDNNEYDSDQERKNEQVKFDEEYAKNLFQVEKDKKYARNLLQFEKNVTLIKGQSPSSPSTAVKASKAHRQDSGHSSLGSDPPLEDPASQEDDLPTSELLKKFQEQRINEIHGQTNPHAPGNTARAGNAQVSNAKTQIDFTNYEDVFFDSPVPSQSTTRAPSPSSPTR